MKKKAFYVGLFMVFVLTGPLTAQQNHLPVLKGLYLGQYPPGKKAERFAEDIITYEPHNSPTFTPDGKEMIICAAKVFSIKNIVLKFFKTLFTTRSIFCAVIAFVSSLDHRDVIDLFKKNMNHKSKNIKKRKLSFAER